MAGIYIHIPFCKQACHYCNFHFSTSLGQKEELLAAIIREIDLQKDYLAQATIETIYFGGGTPSILSAGEIEAILSTIAKHHSIAPDAELTLEANPDDLNAKKLSELKSAGIKRLSIGIQSFHDNDLAWMNRSHDASEARKCLDLARAEGFDNLSADLIFGSNTTTTQLWQENLEIAAAYKLQHLSCYSLTVEKGTALNHFIQSGKITAPPESLAEEQFNLTMDFLRDHGYEHYEISNYAKNKQYSRHNTNYWKQVSYLGIGPSAHSYNGNNRQWNIAHNAKYISSLKENKLLAEIEELSKTDQINEYLLTGLRTMWGCNQRHLDGLHPEWKRFIEEDLAEQIEQKNITEDNNHLYLTAKGKLMADTIISQLFLTNE